MQVWDDACGRGGDTRGSSPEWAVLYNTDGFLTCSWSRIGLVKADPKSLLALAAGEGRVNVGWPTWPHVGHAWYWPVWCSTVLKANWHHPSLLLSWKNKTKKTKHKPKSTNIETKKPPFLSKMSAYFAFFFSFFFSVLFCFFVFFISLSDGLAFRALHLTHSFHGNYTQCWRWYELAVSETKVLEKKLFLFFFFKFFLKLQKKLRKKKSICHLTLTLRNVIWLVVPTHLLPLLPLLFSMLLSNAAWTLDVHIVL